MQNRNVIKSDIDLLSALKLLSEAYEEISVIRMRRIKSSVLTTRDFLSKLAEVFANVKASQKYIESLKKKKEKNFIPKEKKVVSILLSSSSKLYGDIVYRVYKQFSQDMANSKSDVVIIGRVGKEYYEKDAHRRDFTFFDLGDTDIKMEDIKPIIYHMLQYDVIRVYHGKFDSLVSQTPSVSELTSDVDFGGSVSGTSATEYVFLYEPSLETVAGFFETQIFGSLVKQSMNESNLSKYASRVKAMERALENIETRQALLVNDQRKLKKQVENRKQIGSLSGLVVSNY